MTTFAFVAGIVVLFLGLLAYETDDAGERLRVRQLGLWSWLVSGNWPAKVGAILLIIGLGALMRYALIHVAVPPQAKLSAGGFLAAVLGGVSFLLRDRPRRRSLHLAFAGAACGVAYLTAYSAYGLFNYVDSLTGMTLLVVVAGATGIFAVTADAVSIAVLAMIGAYAAPAFAVTQTGPLAVYGYYLAASGLSFVMVLARGWRPLIHLSFLFTLAGGIFFGWTSEYYRPEYYGVMQPMLLALVALHLAMPVAEREAAPERWLAHADTGYFAALPLVAGLLTWSIAPHARPEAALGFAALGALWMVAAAALFRHRAEAVAHAVVAFLFFMAAALAAMKDLSLPLVGVFSMTVVISIASRLPLPRAIESTACFMLVLFAGLWTVDTAFQDPFAGPLLNQWFFEHLAVVALVGWSAHDCRTRNAGYSAVFSFIAAAFAVQTALYELRRLHFDYFAELSHAALLAATFAFLAIRRPLQTLSGTAAALLAFLYASAWWAAADAPYAVAAGFGALDVAVLGFSAVRLAGRSAPEDRLAGALLLAVPMATLPWSIRLYDHHACHSWYFVSSCFALALVLGTALGRISTWVDSQWVAGILSRVYRAAAIALGWTVLLHIERGLWPVVFDLSALATLIAIATVQRDEGEARTQGVIAVIGAALVFQAMLLRALGPYGVMTVADVMHMRLPAVVSLIWATLGAGLAWWGGHAGSRKWWTIGSSLMAVAAAKLVLLDFGSLGELGNILALIAAGLVFLAVAWLVPIPPKPAREDHIEPAVLPPAGSIAPGAAENRS